MNEYKVYFELFGKKMKVTMLADTQHEAKQKVKDSIKFYKVEKIKNDLESGEKFMEDFLNILKPKK